MALTEEVAEYYKLVFELGQSNNAREADNKLSQELITINSENNHNKAPNNYLLDIPDTFENVIQNMNKTCEYLNSSTSDVIKGRTCSSAISLGKESVPLIVSVKQLADSLIHSDVKGCDMNIEAQLRDSISKAEDNCRQREDFCRSISKSIQDMEYVIKNIPKLHAREKGLGPSVSGGREGSLNSVSGASIVSEISGFFENDIVASSPIKDQLVSN